MTSAELPIRQSLNALERHLGEYLDIAGREPKAFFGDDFVTRYAAYTALIQVGIADYPSSASEASSQDSS